MTIELIEMKVSELKFGALDWCIAQVEGLNVELTSPNYGDGTALVYIAGTDPLYRPSTDWETGGPLIEKYKLDIGAPMENQRGPWNAATEWAHPMGLKGETPLIAACRAIVASVLGDTVSVPKELV